MSDAVQPVKKISREGIVLIKSFEGFRPRAVARPEGGWIIGYGHTLSAREGATVSEADAELLLRYDLLTIEKRLNQTAPGGVNQHQFDALASFAFSVGMDQFETSDVLSRLTSGDQGAAAEALLAWPETRSPSVGLRRRAAERALFTADPGRPVALADLLAAPVSERSPQAPSDGAPAPLAENELAPSVSNRPGQPLVAETRAAAVAALLGETQPLPIGPAAAPIVPTFETPSIPPTPVPIDAANVVAPESIIPAPLDQPANDVEPEAIPEPTAGPLAIETGRIDSLSIAAPDTGSVDGFSSEAVGDRQGSASALNVQRYSPYGTPIIGPLSYLAPIESAEPSQDETATERGGSVATVEWAETESLVLTPPDNTSTPVAVRPAWTIEERAEVEAAPAGDSLFGEDLSLTQGGQPMSRSDFELEAPERFDWSETGAFIVMGAVGLTAFGASMAAFRLASEQGGGNETSIIGWVLAVIGVTCVGVSSFNLYRKFGLAGSDR